jgi:hypothetical protein
MCACNRNRATPRKWPCDGSSGCRAERKEAPNPNPDRTSSTDTSFSSKFHCPLSTSGVTALTCTAQIAAQPQPQAPHRVGLASVLERARSWSLWRHIYYGTDFISPALLDVRGLLSNPDRSGCTCPSADLRDNIEA